MNTGKIGQLGSTGPRDVQYMHTWQTTLHLGTYGSPWLVQNYLCQVHMLAHIMYNPAERQATGTAHYIFFFTHYIISSLMLIYSNQIQ